MHINEIRPSKEPKLQKKKNKIAGLQNYKKVWPMWTLWKLNCPVHKQHHHKADYIINIVPHLVFLNLKYAVHIKKKKKKLWKEQNLNIYIYPDVNKSIALLFFSFFVISFVLLFVGIFVCLLFALEKSSTNMRWEQERPNNRTNQQNVMLL